MVKEISINKVQAIGLTSLTTVTLALANMGSANAQIREGLDSVKTEDAAGNDIFDSEQGIFRRVVDILLFLIGAISVIMLIVGGLRYVISAGDQQAVTNAKNTILYAIVGVIVAFVAWGAINFILGELEGDA